MNKIRIISFGIVISILTVILTVWLLSGLDQAPTIQQLLVIIGIAAVFAVFIQYNPFRNKR